MPEERRIPTPAPADLPSFKILVDGSQISAEYQVQAVVVSRSFNRVAEAMVIILDGDPATENFRASAADDFLPGKDLGLFVDPFFDESQDLVGSRFHADVNSVQSGGRDAGQVTRADPRNGVGAGVGGNPLDPGEALADMLKDGNQIIRFDHQAVAVLQKD